MTTNGTETVDAHPPAQIQRDERSSNRQHNHVEADGTFATGNSKVTTQGVGENGIVAKGR